MSKINFLKQISLFLGLCFSAMFLCACDNPFATTPGTQGKNIVTGIYITSETSQLIDVWGNPRSYYNGAEKNKDPDVSDEEEVADPGFYSLEVPYPNPFVPSAMVQFQLPETAIVSIWYETAYLPESRFPLPNKNRTPRTFRKVFLIDEVQKNSGAHVVNLSTTIGENGEEINVPAGFYRVFMKAGDFVAFHDVYVKGAKSEAPVGLRDYFPY
ncbi:MAG: hypothetical protein ROO71_02345 [Balneola sp.]